MDARTANTKLQLYKLIHFSRERDISSATADSLINMDSTWTGSEAGSEDETTSGQDLVGAGAGLQWINDPEGQGFALE